MLQHCGCLLLFQIEKSNCETRAPKVAKRIARTDRRKKMKSRRSRSRFRSRRSRTRSSRRDGSSGANQRPGDSAFSTPLKGNPATPTGNAPKGAAPYDNSAAPTGNAPEDDKSAAPMGTFPGN